jgi:hypothetical protein
LVIVLFCAISQQAQAQSEAFSFADRTLTGKVLADITIDFCKEMNGDAVSQTGMTLVELGVGKYVLNNPNVTERTVCSGYLTADDTKSFSILFDPVDGDIALETTAQSILTDTGTTLDGKIDTIAVDVAGLDGAAMRGTDNAALASVCTEIRLAELDAGNLPANIDTIAGDVAGLDGAAMRGTDGAYTGTPPTAEAIRTEMDNNSTKLAAIPTNPLLTNDARIPATLIASQADVEALPAASDIWGFARRDLTSAYTDESPVRDMAGAVVVLPAIQGQAYTAVAAQALEISIVRGDSPRIPFDLGADYTGWTIKFGAKASSSSTAAYVIALKDGSWSDASAGEGYVDLTSTDTSSAQKLYAEVELRNGDQRLTVIKFVLKIMEDVIR